MKKAIPAALLAAAMTISLTGCSTPASVGKVGDVEIPSGVYLLEQYGAYLDAAQHTDEDDVLKATLSLDDGTEKKGADYVAEKTTEYVNYFAGTEAMFSELVGELSAEELESVKANTESYWSAQESSLKENGIGKESMRLFVENAAKGSALLQAIYGKDGTEPVSDQDLWAFIDENFSIGTYYYLTLMNPATYTAFEGEDLETVRKAAEGIRDAVANGESFQDAAMENMGDVAELLGTELSEDFVNSMMGTASLAPSTAVAYYGEELSKLMMGVPQGDVQVLETTSNILIYKSENIQANYSLDDLRDSALSEMKAEELESRLVEYGASLTHALDSKALSTFAASKIKK